MKFLIFLFLSLTVADATEYYSKVEPIEKYSIKSAVNGKVLSVDETLEGRESIGNIVIKIDDKIDLVELDIFKQKLKSIQNSINLMKKSIKNSKKITEIESENYNRVKNLASYSKVQKDAKLLAMINAQNSYINLQSTLQNLKIQRDDLKLKIESLKDRIDKKNISVKEGFYIYKIYPREGDYVNPSTPLLDIYDTSRAKLVIFIPIDEVDDIKDKKIYIDGKKSDYKIDKIWKIADKQNISSYRVEIVMESVKSFSKLVKIEFK